VRFAARYRQIGRADRTRIAAVPIRGPVSLPSANRETIDRPCWSRKAPAAARVCDVRHVRLNYKGPINYWHMVRPRAQSLAVGMSRSPSKSFAVRNQAFVFPPRFLALAVELFLFTCSTASWAVSLSRSGLSRARSWAPDRLFRLTRTGEASR
jgi:hypothetical protein